MCIKYSSIRRFFFFFFKQKTAYEIMPSLVGSEMCIRDRPSAPRRRPRRCKAVAAWAVWATCCLLYTSDAADDLLCVDLGGRRISKKKTGAAHAGVARSVVVGGQLATVRWRQE